MRKDRDVKDMMRKSIEVLKVLRKATNDKMTLISSTVNEGYALLADEFSEAWGLRDEVKASWVISFERRTMNICRAYNDSKEKNG